MKTEKIIAAGILPICKHTGRILLIRRGFNQPKPGTWACFGGKFEDDDKDTKQAAVREFMEESGYKGKFNISSGPLDVNKTPHTTFYTFIGLFNEEFTPDLGPADEAIDYGWFYLGEVPEDLHPGVSEMFSTKSKTIQNIICFYQDK